MSQQRVEWPEQIFRNAKRVVVKIGSSLIGGQSRDGEPLPLKSTIADLLSALPAEAALCIVTSGAVTLGHHAPPDDVADLAGRQALSAIGQIDLMVRWQEALRQNGRIAAQVLLTPDVTTRRRQYLNARATLRELIDMGAVPVVNENDAVAIEELRYGDNDRLAAMTAGLVNADLLVVLTDIDGLYAENPHENPSADHIGRISYANLASFDADEMVSSSRVGTGGMATKIDAARMAGSWGCVTALIDGRPDHPFSALLNGQSRGTLIDGASAPAPARRKWLRGLSPDGAQIVLDEGAAAAVSDHASLLSVGIAAIEGVFYEGDVVSLATSNGDILGFGLAKISSLEIDASQGQVVMHCDDILLDGKK